ncbi:MAG TPA: hypothetical protein VHB70_19615 [Parafilimonas sp.]|nr:hypothetical protein [Parafilimonas sp.]
MTREELQETYSQFSTQELLEIIDRKFDYTETAVAVALEEISKRRISENDIKSYKTEQIEKAEKFIKYNIVDDLTFFQKNLFFFIWLPILNIALKQNFRDDGYILKLKQARYYSWLGFVSFMLIGMFSGIYGLQNLTALAIWILAFLPAYGFDETFNRQKQIQKLKKIFEKYNNEEK